MPLFIKGDAVAEKPGRWCVEVKGMPDQISLHSRSLAVISSPQDDGNCEECWICMEANNGVRRLGCACRGAAGFAHLACQMQHASHLQEQRRSEGGPGGAVKAWYRCVTCRQDYHGKLGLDMAYEAAHQGGMDFPEADLPNMTVIDWMKQPNIAAAVEGNNWMMRQRALAHLLTGMARYKEAEAIYRKVSKAGAAVPSNIALGLFYNDYEWEVACSFAQCLRLQGKYPEAIQLFQQYLDGYKKRAKDKAWLKFKGTIKVNDAGYVEGQSDLATALTFNGQLKEAEEMYRSVLKTMDRLYPQKDDLRKLITLGCLGALLNDKLKRFAEAEVIFRRIHTIRKQVLGSNHVDTMLMAMNIGVSLTCQKKLAAAVALHRKTHDSASKALGKQHPLTLTFAWHLGEGLVRHGGQIDSSATAKGEVLVREGMELLHQTYKKQLIVCPANLETQNTGDFIQHIEGIQKQYNWTVLQAAVYWLKRN